MKTILKQLEEQQAAKETTDYRQFKQIRAGRHLISIQGSTGRYCSPRKTVEPWMYSSMEIAIFSNKGWLNLKRSKKLKSFYRYSELIDCCDGYDSTCPVFGYVPIDLIEDLYLHLIF